MKNIVILHTIKQFEKYNSMKTYLGNESSSILIAISIELRIFLKNKKINYKIPEQYINDKQAEDMDKAAIYLAENWHKDLFLYKNISLGELCHWDFKYYFSRIVRNLITIENIIKIEKPTEIISFKDKDINIQEFNNILVYICALNNIILKFFSIEKPYSDEKFYVSLKKLIIRYIKAIQSLKPLKLGLKYLTILMDFFRILKSFRRNKKAKKILMIGANAYGSLINEMSKRNKVILLFNRQSLPKIKANIINTLSRKNFGFYKFFEDFKAKKIEKQTKLFMIHAQYEWKRIFNNSNFRLIFNYNGISLWPVIKKKMYKTIFYDFKRLIENIQTIFVFLKERKFDLITLSADVKEFSMTIAIVASKLKIHTLVIQHGITGHPIGFIPSHSEKIAVWGKISKEWLNYYEISMDKMVITGSPRFDTYVSTNRNKRYKEIIKKDVYKQFGIENNKKLIVLATSNQNFQNRFTSVHLNPWEVEKIFFCVLDVLSKLPNSYLIIKLHPNDPNEHIPKELIRSLGIKNASVVRKYRLENLLISSVCLITSWSTTGIEVMFFNKPLICIKFRKKKYPVPYIDYKAVLEVSNCNNLLETLQLIFENPNILKKNQKKFLEDYVYKVDGLSTKRISNLIYDMINS